MPMKKGRKEIGANIREFRTGGRYAKILKKHGKAKAEQVAKAAVLRAGLGPPPTSA